MKKLFLLAFVALGLHAMAQHVTPLNVTIADVKLDSLRTLYIQEPPLYRAALDVAAGQLNKNADELKDAKKELKSEQGLAKEMDSSLKNAAKTSANLKKLYEKEEQEMKSMQKAIEGQQKALGKQKDLNPELRNNYMSLLESQQKDLGFSIREVAERKKSLSELDSQIQNFQTALQNYLQEIQAKADKIAELEGILKERTATVKAEQKAAKSLQ